METVLRDTAGENPDRSRLATSRNRVWCGPGATAAASYMESVQAV